MATGKTYNSIDSKEQLILVQTGKGKLGGYKQDLLISLLNETEVEFYVCTKCKGVMHNACQCGKDQILVCLTCVENKVGSQPMMKARQKIPELKAKCPIATRGCKWNGTLSEMKIHLDVCQEFLVKCKYDCGVILKRCELDNHCSNECLNREVSCEHCQNKIVYRDLNRHYAVCLEFPLLCPNNCGTNLRRKQIDSHIETDCPNTIVKCRYERFGCKEVVKRCEMEEHRNTNESKHLEMTTLFAVSEIEHLEEINTRLSQNVNRLTVELEQSNKQIELFSQRIEDLEKKAVISEKANNLKQVVEKQSAIKESSNYTVVLQNTIGEIYFMGLNSHFSPQVGFETSWKSINIILLFEKRNPETIPVSIIMEHKKMSPHLKLIFEGRFKLTIIDRVNTDSSLIYESPIVKMQTKQQPELGFELKEENSVRFEITKIPSKLFLEDRFKTRNRDIEFTLQIQEAEQVRTIDQMADQNKKIEWGNWFKKYIN